MKVNKEQNAAYIEAVKEMAPEILKALSYTWGYMDMNGIVDADSEEEGELKEIYDSLVKPIYIKLKALKKKA